MDNSKVSCAQLPGRGKSNSDVAPLSVEEYRDLERHEAVIAAGKQTFVQVGRALAAIRDDRLYRATHKSFQAYCRDRWGFHKAHAHRLITAANTVNNLSPVGDGSDVDQAVPLPENERQVRALADAPAKQHAELWQESVKTAPAGKVTAAHVSRTVESHRAKAETDSEPAALERMAEEANVLDAFARRIKSLISELPASPWIDANRRDTIKAQLDTPAATVRAAKGAGLCPLCHGERCEKCRGTGWMPKIELESNGGGK